MTRILKTVAESNNEEMESQKSALDANIPALTKEKPDPPQPESDSETEIPGPSMTVLSKIKLQSNKYRVGTIQQHGMVRR